MAIFPVGTVIPNFSAIATGNKTVQLTDYRGQNVILYFYPKDNTPGCTQEALDFAQHFTRFQALNTTLFGISRDSLRSHENFKARHQLPFELIADTDEQLCRLFDVIQPKILYGKPVKGVLRSSFLINAQGILQYSWSPVKVPGHVAAVVRYLEQQPLT